METRKRILIVDDEPGIMNTLRIKLRLSGYEVITTTSGAEAVEVVRDQEPDLVLLDVLMPDVTGLDVLDRVRTFSRVPIIIFTGRPDIIQVALKLGANDYIAKPFNPDLLVDKIRLVLSTSQPVEGCNANEEEDPPR
ncbi:MAG: response regulator [Nitrospiraceae bacterium]|nr:MAG: response regulator [Nitrospiraceae bacterium]